jgi:hypothetical protein
MAIKTGILYEINGGMQAPFFRKEQREALFFADMDKKKAAFCSFCAIPFWREFHGLGEKRTANYMSC